MGVLGRSIHLRTPNYFAADTEIKPRGETSPWCDATLIVALLEDGMRRLASLPLVDKA